MKPFQMNCFQSAKMMITALSVILVISCSKDDSGLDADAIDRSSTGLSAETIAQLRTAKTATQKYRNMEAAKADGYEDINVVQENMGFHLLKASLLDTIFEPAKPELLVYNKKHNGNIELVAVEYAVPIPLTPNKAPEGFIGSSDSWSYSTKFNLWLLHSWVWEFNPQGIFNPTNPLVHLH